MISLCTLTGITILGSMIDNSKYLRRVLTHFRLQSEAANKFRIKKHENEPRSTNRTNHKIIPGEINKINGFIEIKVINKITVKNTLCLHFLFSSNAFDTDRGDRGDTDQFLPFHVTQDHDKDVFHDFWISGISIIDFNNFGGDLILKISYSVNKTVSEILSQYELAPNKSLLLSIYGSGKKLPKMHHHVNITRTLTYIY